MRYHALDAWRGIGAMIIAASRLEADTAVWHLPFVRHAYPLVDFFFVLSGFVITLIYLDRLDGTGRTTGGFLIRRFGRLWPLHAFVLGLLVALEFSKLVLVWAGVESRSMPFTAETAPHTILANLLLVQAMGLYDHATWNTPAWSISVEFWCYVAFLVAVLMARRALIVVSLVVIAVSLAVVGAFAPKVMDATFDYGFPRALAGFFAGHLVFRVHRACRDRLGGGVGTWTAFEMGIVAAVFWYLSVVGVSLWSLFTPAIMSVLVFVFAAERGLVSRVIVGQVGQALGRWSYSIYLLCPLVAYLIARGVSVIERRVGTTFWHDVPHAEGTARLFALPYPGATELLLASYLGLVVLVSALTFRLVEDPARRFFYRLAARWENRGRQPRIAPQPAE